MDSLSEIALRWDTLCQVARALDLNPWHLGLREHIEKAVEQRDPLALELMRVVLIASKDRQTAREIGASDAELARHDERVSRAERVLRQHFREPQGSIARRESRG